MEMIVKKKLVSLYDIFDEFKKDLKEKIKFEEEYKQYSSIFNENNINNFKIEDLFNFLKENLNYSNASYSMIKKDVTNYNFLIMVITEYPIFKDYVYNNDLDIKI